MNALVMSLRIFGINIFKLFHSWQRTGLIILSQLTLAGFLVYQWQYRTNVLWIFEGEDEFLRSWISATGAVFILALVWIAPYLWMNKLKPRYEGFLLSVLLLLTVFFLVMNVLQNVSHKNKIKSFPELIIYIINVACT